MDDPARRPTEYDPEKRQLTGAKGSVHLPRGIAEFLDLLLANAGRLVSRERARMAMHGAWEREPVEPKSFDVTVCRLRRLLARARSEWRLDTVRQSGWVLERRGGKADG